MHWERFDQPLKVKKPSIIGTVFSGDFFDEAIAENVRASLKIRMNKAPWHTFVVLTKQPQNIDLNEPNPENLCIGVTVNNRKDYWRLNCLRRVKSSFKFASFEPMYEDLWDTNLDDIDWVIIGGQTKPAFIPNTEWIDHLTALALVHDLPVFHKNNLDLEFPLHEYPFSNKLEESLVTK